MEAKNDPRVFISYSWSSPSHEQWVMDLAKRLVADGGVDVIIDKWDLKEGHDKYEFMESMVKSPDIDKVLVILDKKYTEKANQRDGGVGTETQIISPQIYSNTSQEKFIPIVTMKDDLGNPYIPTYLQSRIYIDFSSTEDFENSYEKLLRNLHNAPEYSKPKRGKAPAYLFEENLMNNKTSFILRSFDNQILKDPNRVNPLLRDFLDEFYQNLKEYTIKFNSRDSIEIGKQIVENINSYTPLRNDYIDLIDKLSKSYINYDIDILIRFFEKLPVLKYPQDERGGWSNYEFDNFRFIIHELFISTIAILLKNESYNTIHELLYSSYFFHSKYDHNKDPRNFDELASFIESFNQYYNQLYSKNYYSPAADLMTKRIHDKLSLDYFVEADLICHYVATLNNLRWFPITYVYKTRGHFDFFDRMVSTRHFEKVKIIFNISTADQFKDLLKQTKETDRNPDRVRYSSAFESVQPIYSIINIDRISSSR